MTIQNSNNHDNAPLPEGFTPGATDVVIGKGKKWHHHAGNVWLREVVSQKISAYSKASTKSDKSSIISSVVQFVLQNGRFVKVDQNSWVYAEPLLCREKCSQAFRDQLAETYRSSNISKRIKRRAQAGSASDLILALQSTKIHSSKQNLHHAMSVGNLLLKRKSSARFSAAKKASFSKLKNASSIHDNDHHNASWVPKHNTQHGSMSNKLMSELRRHIELQQQTNHLQADLEAFHVSQWPTDPMPCNAPSSSSNAFENALRLAAEQQQQTLRAESTSTDSFDHAIAEIQQQITNTTDHPVQEDLCPLTNQLLEQAAAEIQQQTTTGSDHPVQQEDICPLLNMPIEDVDFDVTPCPWGTGLNTGLWTA